MATVYCSDCLFARMATVYCGDWLFVRVATVDCGDGCFLGWPMFIVVIVCLLDGHYLLW